jgi:hypothetical protein
VATPYLTKNLYSLLGKGRRDVVLSQRVRQKRLNLVTNIVLRKIFIDHDKTNKFAQESYVNPLYKYIGAPLVI